MLQLTVSAHLLYAGNMACILLMNIKLSLAGFDHGVHDGSGWKQEFIEMHASIPRPRHQWFWWLAIHLLEPGNFTVSKFKNKAFYFLKDISSFYFIACFYYFLTSDCVSFASSRAFYHIHTNDFQFFLLY